LGCQLQFLDCLGGRPVPGVRCGIAADEGPEDPDGTSSAA
jgi:hypothetical protein